MTLPAPHEGFPWLSALTFSPLIAAAVAMVLRGDRAQRWWALISTTAIRVPTSAFQHQNNTGITSKKNSWVPRKLKNIAKQVIP